MMLAAVVPVHNEEKRLKKTLKNLLATQIDVIIPVINGCSDNSYRIVRETRSNKIYPLYFEETLGIDVPRAAGAKIARDMGAEAVLFLDGDMDGEISGNLKELIRAVDSGTADMALTDCYPAAHGRNLSRLAIKVLEARGRLNSEIGLKKHIGVASPCHGPHAVSRRLLLSVPLRELAMPPVALVIAVKRGLKIRIGTTVPHCALGSPGKNITHSELIAHTIIGDCLEAVRVYRGEKRSRTAGPVEYDGYNSKRRWDLLDWFLGGAGV